MRGVLHGVYYALPHPPFGPIIRASLAGPGPFKWPDRAARSLTLHPSNNCIVGYRPCKYELAELILLRDRRSQRVELPGVLDPWAVDSLVKSLPLHEALLSPLDCLPIKLSLESRKLLRHCK